MTKQIAWTAPIFVCLFVGMARNDAAADDETSVYGRVENYRQTLVVENSDRSTPSRAPRLAAVYDAHNWALSTRWDDSVPNALNVRRKMLENGIRGTFYLNSRKPGEPLAGQLTGHGECSVGGHSESHPHLPKLPANEAFRELMANRIELECLTNRPVNSLAFPFGGYQDKDRPEVLHGVTEAVLRTGFHHCVYAGFVTRNEFLPKGLVSTGLQVVPGDRQVDAEKFWKQIEKVRQFESQSRKTSDCIFLGVHPWQEGEELDRLGQVMEKLADWDDFWHCTQTEYAAFAKQRRNTSIETLAPGQFAIVRPAAFELGSDIPLTLVFDGDAVRSAKVDGVDCTVRQADGKTIVNVPHGAVQGAPTRIATEFPGLTASLTFDPHSGEIAYSLENTSDSPLFHAVLTVSTPPAFEPGMLRWRRAKLVHGESWSVSDVVSAERSGSYWRDGAHYVAAQLDFVLDGQRGRLFTTCTVSP